MLWPKAMAGVVRPRGVSTTPRWLPPALPLLIKGGEPFPALMSLCLAHYRVLKVVAGQAATKPRFCKYSDLRMPKDGRLLEPLEFIRCCH